MTDLAFLRSPCARRVARSGPLREDWICRCIWETLGDPRVAVGFGGGGDLEDSDTGFSSSGYSAVTFDVPVTMVVGGATRRLGRLEAAVGGDGSRCHCAEVAVRGRRLESEDFES